MLKCQRFWVIKEKPTGVVGVKLTSIQIRVKSYLIDDGSENKKAKATNKCVIKRQLKSEYYKNCLEATQVKKSI